MVDVVVGGEGGCIGIGVCSRCCGYGDGVYCHGVESGGLSAVEVVVGDGSGLDCGCGGGGMIVVMVVAVVMVMVVVVVDLWHRLAWQRLWCRIRMMEVMMVMIVDDGHDAWSWFGIRGY